MKITQLNIDSYQQFKNLQLNFTYPIGHPLEGQPLKKVCFIGQSGTGKTTLLNFLKQYVESEINGTLFLDFLTDQDSSKEIVDNNIKVSNDSFISDQDTDKVSLVYLTTTIESSEKGLFAKIDSTEKSLISSGRKFLTLESLERDYTRKKEGKTSLTFDSNFDPEIWKSILKDIEDYDNKLRNKGAELIQKGTSKMSVEKTLKELDKWKKENPNPRVDLAQKCLNRILHKFYLDIDTENIESYIAIKPRHSEHAINYTGLSTGTKQILLTAIPIFKYASNKVIYLFDEPERSLFPDLQQMLIDYYVSLAPDAQFFFATHSPVVASQFEPCERFILYFDENGDVKVRNGVAPQGDDPNDILKKDFGMQHLMTSKGLEMYNRYLKLISQSRKAKTDEDKKKLLDEIAEIAETYNY